jgi:hypothetical protein
VGCAAPTDRDGQKRQNVERKPSAVVTAGELDALARVAVTASSRQAKLSAAIEQDYVLWHGERPTQPTLVDYTASVEPAQVIRAGNDVRLRSTIEVVSGTKASVREVRVELVLLSPAGGEFQRRDKLVNENGTGSGQYENVFTFKLPGSAPQGVYTAKTIVYLNGTRVAETNSRVELIPERFKDILD